jgi:hypothetical protein
MQLLLMAAIICDVVIVLRHKKSGKLSFAAFSASARVLRN